jgi:hypothetical protein
LEGRLNDDGSFIALNNKNSTCDPYMPIPVRVLYRKGGSHSVASLIGQFHSVSESNIGTYSYDGAGNVAIDIRAHGTSSYPRIVGSATYTVDSTGKVEIFDFILTTGPVMDPCFKWEGRLNDDGGFIALNNKNSTCEPYGPMPLRVHYRVFDGDRDGMPDWWEATQSLNPFSDDSSLDPDVDGLNNLEEYQNDTNPNNPDSDGDGLTDADEVNIHGTNPNNPDSDDDTINDDVDACPNDPDNDIDEDGICEDLDNCPGGQNPPVANWTDIYGDEHMNTQPDYDLDLIGDFCDPDDDNDYHLDVSDNCPLTYNPGQENLDADGLGNVCDPDADNDGFNSYEYGGDDCDDMDDLVNPGAGNCLAVIPAPEKGPGERDSDSDNIRNSRDNCPNDPNTDQADGDSDNIGDVCDTCPDDPNNDVDGDGICGDIDSCPNDPNLGTDADGDGIDDACDPVPVDSDADGYFSVATGGDDCDDTDPTVNPGATEIPANGVDDDCDPATLDSTADYHIDFQMAGYDTWLPSDGNVATVNVDVKDSSGATVTPDSPGITYTVTSVTTYGGKFTNDPSTSTANDFFFDERNDVLTLTSNDFGGSITVHAEAYVTDAGGTRYLAQSDFTLPKDSDGDGVPDAHEIALNGNLSTLTSASADDDGDGLTILEEFRGFKWGPPMVVIPGSLTGTFQTTAYVPQGDAGHFRTHPGRKDFFVKVDNYEFNVGNPDTGYDAPCDCPFALGTAFHNAGVDVHAVSVDNLPSFMTGGIASWERNIDAATITNNLTGTYSTSDGHIRKRGIRDWEWSTKGFSGIGDSITYGGGTKTYQLPLDNYFGEYPYIDSTAILGSSAILDPVDGAFVEDQNDNGTNDRRKGKLESEAAGDVNVLEGDLLILPIDYTHHHTALDVDHDGRVELPVINDPNDPSTDATGNTYPNEYTRAQVLKHTITHELGHAVGMSHNSCSTCLMYEWSTNWSRDDNFSGDEQSQSSYHNN